MKKYKTVLFLLAGAMLLNACNKYLETEPTSFISPENYYSNERELTASLLGLYGAFDDNNTGLYSVNSVTAWTIPTDEVFRNNTTGNNCLAYDATDGGIATYWAQCYRYINNCNVFLENVDKPVMDNTKREVYRGEALFIRAYCYFLLASQFGDVPLKLSSTQSVYGLNVHFTPVKDIYEQVLKDMTTAEAKVNDLDPSLQQPTRVNKQVVRGILARVCLYMAGYPLQDVSKYQDARDWAKKVVDANKNKLNPDYTQIWINIAKDSYDLNECMWEAEFQVPQAPYYRGGSWGGQTGPGIACPNTNTDVGVMLDWYKITYTLASLYNTDTLDVRKNWNIAPFYYRATAGVWETPRDSLNTTPALKSQKVIDKNPGKLRRKYETVKPSVANSGMNFPILRYADVVLMYAEAENELNGPFGIPLDLLNMVRTRAKCSLLYSSNATNSYFKITDIGSFRKAIQDERARELCFEYTRRNDLIRWGIYQQTMQNEAQNFITNNYQTTMANVYKRAVSKHNLLPIPVTEISLNNLSKQNSGW